MIRTNNRVCQLFSIPIPIIQGGMVWCSGWRLATAVSNAGGLGLIGSGSMRPEVLREHIQKAKKSTTKPFGVNVPLLYPAIDEVMKILVEEDIKIVFTSAGNPEKWTGFLKDKGIKVIHVTASLKFAKKAELAGVDAIVAEGFEAGGHNGRDETTTFVLVPLLKNEIDIPIIAAGGIASGRAMLAAESLGAEGVQIGSRFASCIESSAHQNFKKKVIDCKEGDTILTLKKLTPVRLLKNKFYEKIQEAEDHGAAKEKLAELLGKGRSRQGIFEGNLDEGELEIGQVSCSITSIKSAGEIIEEIITEYNQVKKQMCDGVYYN